DLPQDPWAFKPFALFQKQSASPCSDEQLFVAGLKHRPDKEVGYPAVFRECSPAAGLVMVETRTLGADPRGVIAREREREHAAALEEIRRGEHLHLPRSQPIQPGRGADPDIPFAIFAQGSHPIVGKPIRTTEMERLAIRVEKKEPFEQRP